MNYDVIKRTMDVVGCLVLLVLFSPIMIVTAVAIKITSPGPVFVEKENEHMRRLGKN